MARHWPVSGHTELPLQDSVHRPPPTKALVELVGIQCQVPEQQSVGCEDADVILSAWQRLRHELQELRARRKGAGGRRLQLRLQRDDPLDDAVPLHEVIWPV